MAERKNYTVEPRAAKIVARDLMSQRPPTCEGCYFLKRWPRPMCAGESSAHFRTVRDTHHARCSSYSSGAPKPKEEVKPPPRVSPDMTRVLTPRERRLLNASARRANNG